MSMAYGLNDSEFQAKFDHIKLCVFDMAGTTVDEDNLVYKTVRDAINQKLTQSENSQLDNIQVDLPTCLEFGAGKEKRTAINDILNHVFGNIDSTATDKDTDEDTINDLTDTAFATFKKTLSEAYTADTIQPFDGMADLFHKLRASGRHVVLNTGYDRKTAEKIIGLLGWQVGDTIDGLITADDVTNGRPASDMIELAMTQTDVTDSTHVMKAGDSGIDIEEGKNANCGLSIGVLSGAQNREQLIKFEPDAVLDKLTDLGDYLNV